VNDTVKHLADPEFRQAVIANLRERAETTSRCGDRAELRGMYKLANANWQIAAKRVRAAKALEAGENVHQDDLGLVEQACGEVRDLMWASFARKDGVTR
jgi:hypothetical protein